MSEQKKDDNKNYTNENYQEDFISNEKIREKALNYALDIRKFEIELYWKRAIYFWAFIATIFAAYFTIQNLGNSNKEMSIIISLSGLILSYGWLCVNKGSKQWVENWENHVYMLEDKEIGPLYKVTLSQPEATSKTEKSKRIFFGPESYSVTKINLIISIYITLLWFYFLFKSLFALLKNKIDCNFLLTPYTLALILSLLSTLIIAALVIILFAFFGKTFFGEFNLKAVKRAVNIEK